MPMTTLKKIIRRMIALALLTAAPAAIGDAGDATITRADWPPTVTAQAILALPAVRLALQYFQENAQITLLVKHPEGAAGLQWARELHAWLVSFGVPAARLELQAMDAERPPDHLLLRIANR